MTGLVEVQARKRLRYPLPAITSFTWSRR